MAFPIVDGLRAIEFGTPGPMRQHLVGLVVNGDKRATAGLLAEYEEEGEPIEHVGERLAVLDDDGRRVATIRITEVVLSRFADVPDRFALAEAEGDLTAADFRASHTRFWTSIGAPVSDDTLVVQLYFDLEDAAASERAGSGPYGQAMSPADVVTAFIRAIEAGDLEHALALVADDVEYDNVPIGKVHGPDAIRQTLGPLLAGATSIEWVIYRQAAEGHLVFNERLDRFELPTGWVEIPVTGVWEVHAGAITLWRDYFDEATFMKQLPGSS